MVGKCSSVARLIFAAFLFRRLVFQVESMLKYYKVPVLLIEFNPEKVRDVSSVVQRASGMVEN